MGSPLAAVSFSESPLKAYPPSTLKEDLHLQLKGEGSEVRP